MSLILGEHRSGGLDLKAAGQYGLLQLDEEGNLKTAPGSYKPAGTFVRKQVALTPSTDGGVIWDPAEGKRFVCTRITVSASAAGKVLFLDGEGV